MNTTLSPFLVQRFFALQVELIPQVGADMGGLSSILEQVIRVLEWSRIESLVYCYDSGPISRDATSIEARERVVKPVALEPAPKQPAQQSDEQASSRSGAVLESAEWVPEFICLDLDLDLEVLNYVAADNAAMPGCPPIKTISLATLGAAGRVNRGRAAALRKRDALRDVLADTDVVFLVAGLGGGTGSGVMPIMAGLAREAGALTVAAVVTPFGWQGWRTSGAAN